MRFDNARVPGDNLLGEAGAVSLIAEALMGPAIVHHCLCTLGQCELAQELMRERAVTRRVSGRSLDAYANVQDWIVRSTLWRDPPQGIPTLCASTSATAR